MPDSAAISAAKVGGVCRALTAIAIVAVKDSAASGTPRARAAPSERERLPLLIRPAT